MTKLEHINEAELRDAIASEPMLHTCSEPQISLFMRIIDALVDGQSRMNLTAIKDPLAMVRYHIGDSLALHSAMRRHNCGVTRAADVGTGGGFPLLPMAVVCPDIQWVGIESVGKKADYVQGTAQKLELQNVTMLASRAEDAGKGPYRATFDLVTSRAVGPVASLLEVQMPLLSVGGRIYLYKNESSRSEWDACKGLISELGGTTTEEFVYTLEGDLQPRVLFIAKKEKETPAVYPRAAGVPFKKPLVKWVGGESTR